MLHPHRSYSLHIFSPHTQLFQYWPIQPGEHTHATDSNCKEAWRTHTCYRLIFQRRVGHKANLCEMATGDVFWCTASVEPEVIIRHLVVPHLYYVSIVHTVENVSSYFSEIYILSIVTVAWVVLQWASRQAVKIVLSKLLQCHVVFLLKSRRE